MGIVSHFGCWLTFSYRHWTPLGSSLLRVVFPSGLLDGPRSCCGEKSYARGTRDLEADF